MPRRADIGPMLLRMIPREPDKIDTPRLVKLLEHQGVKRTARAVQVMLHSLAAEHPIRCLSSSKPFMWQWPKEVPKDNLQPMDAHTALTLKLAHAHLADLLPVSTIDLLKTQMRRADEALKSASPVASWAKKVQVFPRGIRLLPPKVDREVLAVAYEALLSERRFTVTYRRRGKPTDETFEVNPLGLVARGSLLTLVCTIGTKMETRQLHLHRMKGASLLKTPVLVPDGFDLEAHIRDGNLSFRIGGPRVHLRAWFHKGAIQTLEETPLSTDQRIRVDGDRALLEATMADTMELRGWLASYGPRVEVIEPAAIREQLAADARATAALYAPATPSSPPRPRRSREAPSDPARGRRARGGA